MKHQTEFEPDLIIAKDHPLFIHATAYLDGQKLKRCFEARIHWGSFVEPTFGEVVIGATRGDKQDIPVILSKPHLGEFECQGLWAKFACGKVLIELTETGQKLLETIVRPYQGL